MLASSIWSNDTSSVEVGKRSNNPIFTDAWKDFLGGSPITSTAFEHPAKQILQFDDGKYLAQKAARTRPSKQVLQYKTPSTSSVKSSHTLNRPCHLASTHTEPNRRRDAHCTKQLLQHKSFCSSDGFLGRDTCSPFDYDCGLSESSSNSYQSDGDVKQFLARKPAGQVLNTFSDRNSSCSSSSTSSDHDFATTDRRAKMISEAVPFKQLLQYKPKSERNTYVPYSTGAPPGCPVTDSGYVSRVVPTISHRRTASQSSPMNGSFGSSSSSDHEHSSFEFLDVSNDVCDPRRV